MMQGDEAIGKAIISGLMVAAAGRGTKRKGAEAAEAEH